MANKPFLRQSSLISSDILPMAGRVFFVCFSSSLFTVLSPPLFLTFFLLSLKLSDVFSIRSLFEEKSRLLLTLHHNTRPSSLPFCSIIHKKIKINWSDHAFQTVNENECDGIIATNIWWLRFVNDTQTNSTRKPASYSNLKRLYAIYRCATSQFALLSNHSIWMV